MKWFRKQKNKDIKSTLQGTWDYDLMELMKNSKAGDGRELQEFLQTYAPFAAVNERCSRLFVLRPFRVAWWSGSRSVMNGAPQTDEYQWGITITSSTNTGSSQSYVTLPNDRIYSGLETRGDDQIEILLEGEENVLTNYAELCFKLALKSDDREQAIADRFRLLCNEQYPEPIRISAKNEVLELPSFGELKYRAEYRCYECKATIENQQVIITLEGGSPEAVKRLMAVADQKLCSKFYEPVLSRMAQDMVLLKNDFWLNEEEEPIAVNELGQRIIMDRIVFETDGSILIYCNDDGLFGGHTVLIEVDAEGNYIRADLAG